jgi:hypothetical protein
MTKLLEVLEVYERHCSDTPTLGMPSRIKKVTDTRRVLINPDYIVTARPFLGDLNKFTDNALEAINATCPASEQPSYIEVVLDGNSFRSSSMILSCALTTLVSNIERLTVE